MKRSAVLLACIALAAAADSGSEWKLPHVNGALYVAVLTQSERSYTILLAEYLDDVAGAPERVELPLKSSERKSLDRARKALEKKEYDKVGTMVRNFVRRNPANYDALVLGAKALHQQGKDDEALVMLRNALIGNRRSPEAWTLLRQVAAKLGKRVVRPRMEPRGWVKPPDKKGDIEVGYCDASKDEDAAWLFYAPIRAVFRYEGKFREVCPKRKDYYFTFTEQIHAVGSVVRHAEIRVKSKEPNAADVTSLLEEKGKGTIVPFAFFAMYPEPIPAKPEPGFDKLRPLLIEYFDRHILVDESS